MIEPRQPAVPAQAPVAPRTPTTIGLVLTALVIFVAGVYLWLKASHSAAGGAPVAGGLGELLLSLPVADVGQFTSGIAAVLAFLWIILAMRQQNVELRLQREELGLQRTELALQRVEAGRLAEQAHEQVEILRQTAAIARRESFMRFLDLYERKLVLEASQISSMTAIDPAATANHHNAWRDYEQGDRNALFQNLIRQLVRGEHREFLRRVELVQGGHVSVDRFCATASDVLREAAAVDEQMVALCRTTQWAYLAELLEKARIPGLQTHGLPTQ